MAGVTTIYFARFTGQPGDSGTPELLLHTAMSDIITDADKDKFDLHGYTGVGGIMSVDDISLSVDGSANDFSLRLSVVSPELRELILTRETLTGCPVHLRQAIATLDGDALRIHTVIDVARGWINTEAITNESLEISCLTPAAQVLGVISHPTLWTQAQQQRFVDPEDGGLFQSNRTARTVELIFSNNDS